MRIALCNEVLRELDFGAQCDLAARLGYDGLEIAPFTLGDQPHRLPLSERARLKRRASDAGIAIVGLHWLLVTPPGLSITTRDAELRRKTTSVLRGLIALCADLGGKVLVHGSPSQRQVPPGEDGAQALKWVRDLFRGLSLDAERAGVAYCIEALPPSEVDFINTVEEAAQLAKSVGSKAFQTMIDCRAASLSETMSVPDLIDEWLPGGMIAHIHLNDRNKRAPGQGEDRFAPVLAALLRNGYRKTASVEPFEYTPDGPTAAARAIGYLRGILEALSSPQGGGATPTEPGA